MMKLIIFISLFLSFVVSQTTDEITNLPGAPKTSFKQYGGYVTVDAAHQRDLYYWFFESQSSLSDPVVLWLNGGPGCSSIAGMMTENGPFRPNSDGKTLSSNPWSWNKVANVVYLDSPAGVGFSKTGDPSDYTVGDKRTANDTYTFLLGFFDRYPQFKNNEFWITGESYGGHYVTEAANRVLEGNAAGRAPKINLKGIMAGNPWTYMPIDNYGAVWDWWSHALISDDTFYGMNTSCDFTDIGPLKKRQNPSATCSKFINDAFAEMGNINIYDIYVDVCPSGIEGPLEQLAKYSKFHQLISENQKSKRQPIDPKYAPCIDNFMTNYLNLPEVQKAIHADISYPYSECSSLVHYNYSDVEKSVIPLYEKFLTSTDLQILVYSGDVDAIVPYPGTRQWVMDLVKNMPLSTKQKWSPWYIKQQVGGYIQTFTGKQTNLNFATVRNAGHMVPMFQPERAFVMFSTFLEGKPWPVKS